MFARQIDLQSVTTPLRSPQSNGIAESFVKTIKRDYAVHMPNLTDKRRCAVCRLPSSTTTSSIRSALNYRSLREFRRLAAVSI